MNKTKDEIINIILSQMDKLGVPRSTSEQTIIGALDSIELVNFIMDLEAELGGDVKLMSDKAFSKATPFQNASTLADFILESV